MLHGLGSTLENADIYRDAEQLTTIIPLHAVT
jgi:hypothetical protein